MVTAEDIARANEVQRREIDAAYQRGFDDGGDGKFFPLVAGVLAGAFSTAVWFWLIA